MKGRICGELRMRMYICAIYIVCFISQRAGYREEWESFFLFILENKFYTQVCTI